MPRKRSAPTKEASASKPSVVVSLQKVLYNGQDPTLELDGLIELVIKDERKLQSGVSWTAGSFTTEQTLSVLCGNYIIESVNLTRFARSLRDDPASWKAEGAFSSLTLQYPSSASFTNFLQGRTTLTAAQTGAPADPSGGTEKDGTPNTLQVFFASHDAYAETASELEKLKILKPVVPPIRPHSIAQVPVGILRPRCTQSSRASPPRLTRPSSAQPNMEMSRQHSGFHPGRFLSTSSYRPLQRNSRGQLLRRVVDMPPPALRMSPAPRPGDRATFYAPPGRMMSPQEYSGLLQSHQLDPMSLHSNISQAHQGFGSQESFDSSDSLYRGSQDHRDFTHEQTSVIGSFSQPSTQSLYQTRSVQLPPRVISRSIITPLTPPILGIETETRHLDHLAATPSHMPLLPVGERWAKNQRTSIKTRPGTSTTGHDHHRDTPKPDCTQIVMEGMDHFHAIQKKYDAAMTASDKGPENAKRILAEHANEFGRIWSALCK